jgi:YVTN family beta-propeller protein
MSRIGAILFFGLMAISFFSCKRQPPPSNNPGEFKIGQSVFILNEGNFQQGNASVGHYDFKENTIQQKVFQNANQRPVGDVMQSASMIQGNLYLVINNSGKIEIVNPVNMKSKAVINGFVSPRYIVQVSVNKAYVSDLYADEISIVDLKSNQKAGSIKLKGWTEQMLVYKDEVWVTNYTSKFIYVIDTLTDLVQDSIEVGTGGQSIVLDKENKIWVLCRGDVLTGEPGRLSRIEPDSIMIEKIFAFPLASSPFRLQINKTGDWLFYLDESVYSLNISDNQLPVSAMIQSNGRNFYALQANAGNNELYVSDATDFVQNGMAYRFTNQGNVIDSFKTGIIPGDFLFY